MALCTREDVKTFLSIVDTTKDAMIDNLIPMAENVIEEYCGRLFGQAALIEYHTGGTNRILTKQYPIQEAPLPVVWEDNNRVFGSDTIVSPSDYFVDYTNGVFHFDYTLETGYGAIKVSYVYGYATVPKAMNQVCIELIARRMKIGSTGDIGVITKGTPGGITVTFNQDDLLPADKFILDLFKRPLSA